VEILGQSRFPPIRETPYVLSLGPHGYYWFRIERPDGGDEPYGIERTAI
jgi:maltose alpha-D-glucosyltransferase/alpha-amylase